MSSEPYILDLSDGSKPIDTFLDTDIFETYNESDGTECPNCASTDLDWDAPTWTDEGTMGLISCNLCGAKWSEECKRNNIVWIERPEV